MHDLAELEHRTLARIGAAKRGVPSDVVMSATLRGIIEVAPSDRQQLASDQPAEFLRMAISW
jgi:hypothetical protein